jgi:DNA-binding NarL/FixJ family response regulator
MTTILLADDQAMVREGLRLVLESEPDIEVVGEAGDGEAAVREALLLRPHVVLMDIRMPGTDGLTATRRLAAGGRPGPRVLVLTTFDLDEYVYEALRAGASGFLLKDSPRAHLVHAVRSVAAGDQLLDPC